MEQTITPSGLFADVLLPICTHFERHDVALPWYKGHYYIHRPKVIEPLGESKTDFQVFTELAYRIGHLTGIGDAFGRAYNPKATRDYFHHNDDVDEAYLRDWWVNRVMRNQGVQMSWEEFKRRGIYKFVFDKPKVAFREQIEQGKPFPTASGKIEILSSELAWIKDWTKTRYGSHIPSIPKWIEPQEYLDSPIAKKYPFHLISPHPRWRTHSIFHNCTWLRETYEQEVTINASDAARLGIKTGDIVEIWTTAVGWWCPPMSPSGSCPVCSSYTKGRGWTWMPRVGTGPETRISSPTTPPARPVPLPTTTPRCRSARPTRHTALAGISWRYPARTSSAAIIDEEAGS